MNCRFRLLLGAVAACAALAGVAAAAAQDKPHAPKASASPKHKSEPQAKSKAPKRSADAAPADTAAGAGAPARATERHAATSARSSAKPQPARASTNESRPTSAPPPMAADDLAGNVRSEGGTEVKALEFSGLDIEGQLKSPQMLYFLKRVRAEFEHPRLPHRSFMPELARSVEERDF